MSADLVEIEHLRVRFRRMGFVRRMIAGGDPFLDAVLDVSMNLRRGETFGLVGESGSGKTTLGRAIVGLVRAQQGSIRFEGRELTRLSAGRFRPFRRDIAMMFQDPVASLSPRRPLRALVTEPLVIHGRANGTANGAARPSLEEEARRLFGLVGLPANFLGRYPHELSGGQARRVGVARALALNPKLIIADEPTAGLDVSVQGEILNLMARLQADFGLTYMVITHNLPVIRHISDTIAVMYMGRLVEMGPTRSVYHQPAHPYTKALLAGVPEPDPAKRRTTVSIEGEVPSLSNRPRGCEFHTRCPFAQDICRTQVPAWTSLDSTRRVRCHFPLS